MNLGEYNVRGVFDTMHRWWLGAKRHVSLDDIAWALGIESSKTAEVEGSKVFDLYQAGKTRSDSRIQSQRRARDAESLRTDGRQLSEDEPQQTLAQKTLTL